MSIEIGSIRVKTVSIETKDDGTIRITGVFEMISSKGKVVAKQTFNSYDGITVEFDKALGKNIVSDIESAIELEIGIQETVKDMKGEK